VDGGEEKPRRDGMGRREKEVAPPRAMHVR
jgi:hypothetical protein